MAYLNSFSDPQPQRRSAKPFLWVYSAKNEARYQTTKECATENYFYCFDKDGTRSFEVEHAIAELENLSLPLLLRAQQGTLPASAQDRLTLAGYVALAASRTPTAKSIFNQIAIDAQVNALREIANVPGKLEAILGARQMESGERLIPDEELEAQGRENASAYNRGDWFLRCMFEETFGCNPAL